jgi:mannobiose 2-epimerase
MMHRARTWFIFSAALGLFSTTAMVGSNAAAQTGKTIAIHRIPDWQIQEHISHDWLRDTITHGLMDYWVKNSVAPNGFIQEDMDRQWKHWGSQEEATINGQGRQLLSMTLVYEMNGRSNKEYLDAITRSANFMMTKMHDPEYGGYFLRVGSDGHVIQDGKTGYQSFALYSLATLGRVTGDQKYLTAAMDLFRIIRDKMSDGQLFGAGGTYTRDWKKVPGGPFGGSGAAARLGFVDAMGWSSGHPPNSPMPNFGALFGNSKPAHCVDLHMFEAMMGLYRATKSPEVWKVLDGELSAISRIYDYKVGYLSACYDADWKPVGPATANPGHYLYEWASELSEAVELGADPKFIGMSNRIIDFANKETYNTAIGGLGAYDAQGKPQPMLWWPQCEVVKATGMFAILHDREDLWPWFHESLDFIRNNYFDREDGGWFEWYLPGKSRAEQGPRAFYKGSVDGPEWGAYHPTMLFYQLWRITAPDFQPLSQRSAN